jgi:hypothetical protein
MALPAGPLVRHEVLALLTAAKRELGGEVVQVQPTPAEPKPIGPPAGPEDISSLGPKRVGPFSPCTRCGRGAWVRYGEKVLCRSCATVIKVATVPGNDDRPDAAETSRR